MSIDIAVRFPSVLRPASKTVGSKGSKKAGNAPEWFELPNERGEWLGLAIEVDGPTHFMANAPHLADGATGLRNRGLEFRGWKVVSVPVLDWQKLGTGSTEQLRFLEQLMKLEKDKL